MTERPNALLTSGQRDKISDTSDSEYTRQYRQRVRERTRNGTIDLGVLFQNMEERDIEQVFGPDTDHLEAADEVLVEIREDVSGRGASMEIRKRFSELNATIEEYRDEYTRKRDGEKGGKFGERGESNEDKKEEFLHEVEIRTQKIIKSYQDHITGLNRAVDRLNELRQKENLRSYHEQIHRIQQKLDHRKEEIQSHVDELEEILDELRYIMEVHPMESDEILDELLELPLPHFGRRKGHWIELEELHSEIREKLNEGLIDPSLREDVVSAIAFFLRVSEVLGTDTTELVEDAINRTYEKEYPEQVVGHVTTDISTANRDEAAEDAKRKLSNDKDRLDSTELRAIAETDPSQLEVLRQPREITQADLREAVLKEPERLEEGLTIEDDRPKVPDDTPTPDLVARDIQGNIVVIELKRETGDLKTAVDRIRDLIKNYGGEDRVRGFIVTPEGKADTRDIPKPDGPIEFKKVVVEAAG